MLDETIGNALKDEEEGSDQTRPADDPEGEDIYRDAAGSEPSDSNEKEEEEDDNREADDNQNDADHIAVAVDWMEFEGALENNSPELKSFLNIVTGDVIRIFEGSDKGKSINAENNDEYVLIEPISSKEQYHWMEEFIETVEDAPLKEKLNIAIDGKGAFRRFKDVLMGYPGERERWFAKRSTKLHAHMIEWIKLKRIKPGNIPPWDAAYSESRRFDEKKNRNETEPRGGWREGQTDLRALCHDMIDLIPSRELPTAAAFLEFLRGRRGFRRPNYT